MELHRSKMVSLRAVVDNKLRELATAREQVRREKEALAALALERADLTEALALSQAVAKSVQEAAHHQIADIVSKSLKVVFDEPYEFTIIWEGKRGRTEARLVFIRDGREFDPLSSCGGGVVDVAAFALRLSSLMLSRPAKRRVLLLDEPFRFVSVACRPRLRALLELLARELECQFVIVTHMEELKMGKVLQL